MSALSKTLDLITPEKGLLERWGFKITKLSSARWVACLAIHRRCGIDFTVNIYGGREEGFTCRIDWVTGMGRKVKGFQRNEFGRMVKWIEEVVDWPIEKENEYIG